MRPSADALMAGDTLSNWPHFYDPLTCWETYSVLLDGLVAAKAGYRAALAVHDRALAAVQLAEITDLTWLCGEMATSLALQRSRFPASDRAWPLGRVG